MKKEELHVRISEELDRKLRNFLSLKYQKYEKGLLSIEVEDAIKHWIALHTNSQKTLVDKAPNPMPKVSIAFIEVKHYLMKYFFELRPGFNVPDVYLREAIQNVKGSDKRTVEKWLRIFVGNDLIKRLSFATWELI